GRAALGRGVAAKTRTRAAAGSLLFLLVSPGVFAGLIPWLLTRWEMRDPFEGWVALRIVGVLLLAAGTGVVLQAFARFAFEGFGGLCGGRVLLLELAGRVLLKLGLRVLPELAAVAATVGALTTGRRALRLLLLALERALLFHRALAVALGDRLLPVLVCHP